MGLARYNIVTGMGVQVRSKLQVSSTSLVYIVSCVILDVHRGILCVNWCFQFELKFIIMLVYKII